MFPFIVRNDKLELCSNSEVPRMTDVLLIANQYQLFGENMRARVMLFTLVNNKSARAHYTCSSSSVLH